MCNYEELKEDVKRHGIRQPLIVTDKGRVVNGWKRLQIARELNIAIVPVVVVRETSLMTTDMLWR